MHLFFSSKGSAYERYCNTRGYGRVGDDDPKRRFGRLSTGEMVEFTMAYSTKEVGEVDYKWDDKIYLGEGTYSHSEPFPEEDPLEALLKKYEHPKKNQAL